MPLSTVAGLIAYVDEISVVLGTCSPSAKAPETIASLICSATCRNNGVVPEKSNRIRRLQRLVGSISTSSTLPLVCRDAATNSRRSISQGHGTRHARALK